MCVCACVRASVRVRACVRACARVRACVRMCLLFFVFVFCPSSAHLNPHHAFPLLTFDLDFRAAACQLCLLPVVSYLLV